MSWSRDPEEGTIFIKSVCDVFKTAYNDIPNNLSLAQMVNQLNDKLSGKEVVINGDKVIVQVAECLTRTKGEVYFLPKNVNIIFFFTKSKSH